MCGIVGYVGGEALERPALEASCRMLAHRGPDGTDTWTDDDVPVGLSHRRLAILDLSEAGRQPMRSASGRYTIVYNGEIYNHLQLRRQLDVGRWRGHSDTETLLACVEAWGVERTLQAAVGMFAIGLFDAATRRLVLARDRLGEKPLYYGPIGRGLAFASELKALRTLPGFDDAIDRAALRDFLRHGHVPSPRSIFARVRKLPPGTWLTIALADRVPRWSEPVPYWSARDVACRATADPLPMSEAEAVARTEALLGDIVEGQLISDVPLGALLSGGIDSSLVVAMMQARSRAPVRTFSIGFDEHEYDESPYAAQVARHLGTQHTEHRVRAEDLLQLVPRLPEIYDEPFADASQLPTTMVMQIARRQVTVALSGDGGDELFGGYNRHVLANRVWPLVAACPRAVRFVAAGALRAVRPATWDTLERNARRLAGRRTPTGSVGERLHVAAGVLGSADGRELYRDLTSRWADGQCVRDAGSDVEMTDWPGLPDVASNVMLLDALHYLPDDVLVKVDRAAMAASLETRAPFLDHRMYEFAWRLPREMKLRGGTGKWILRQVLYRHVPQPLVDRPKMGFSVPLARWLRGPLRDWAEALLDPGELARDGCLDATEIRRRWQEHLSGRREWHPFLWRVLMFQAWRERAA